MSQVFGVAWYRFRATFGRRWGGYLTIVLLVGLLGGLAVGAVAGARRTQSAYPTYLSGSHASDPVSYTHLDVYKRQVVDDEVCGSASLVDHDMSDPPESTEDLRPWLSGVYVKPERRKTGLGAALVEAVEKAASNLHHPRLYLYTGPVTAVKFYAPMGWEKILSPRYEGKEVVVMQKVLAVEKAST